jgi:hypothetical protein
MTRHAHRVLVASTAIRRKVWPAEKRAAPESTFQRHAMRPTTARVPRAWAGFIATERIFPPVPLCAKQVNTFQSRVRL